MRQGRIAAPVIAAVVFFVTSAGNAADAECLVADPTGTPLNVRSAPNGQVVSTLGNGLSVEVAAETRAGGRRWVQVSLNGERIGWVFADFLHCRTRDDKLKSAPMRPRVAPD